MEIVFIIFVIVCCFLDFLDRRRKKVQIPKHRTSKRYLSYSDFLHSNEWRDIKNNLFSIRGKKCEKCESTVRIQVHHKHYNKPWGEEKPEDLLIVCETCHEKIHGI